VKIQQDFLTSGKIDSVIPELSLVSNHLFCYLVICFVFSKLISPSSSQCELRVLFALMSQIRLSLLTGDKNNIYK